MWSLNHLLLRLHLKRIDHAAIREWLRVGDTRSLALALRNAPHYRLRLFALEQLSMGVLPLDPHLMRALIHLVTHDLLVVAEPAAARRCALIRTPR